MRIILIFTLVFGAAEPDNATQPTTSANRSIELVADQLADIAMEQGHKALSARATKLRKSHGEPLIASSLAKLLSHDEPKVKAAAAFVFGNTDIKPKGALPELIKAINDFEVAEMLSDYGPGSIPQTLADTVVANDENSYDAGWAIGYIGAKAKSAVPTLIKALECKDNEVRWHVAGLLGDLGSASKDAVPALITIVKLPPVETKQSTTDNEVRGAAALSLGEIGVKSETVVPLLIQAVKEDDIHVRKWAAIGLGRFGPKAKQAIPILIESLKDPRFEVPKWQCGNCGFRPDHWGTTALVCIGPDSIPALTNALNGTHLAVRRHAAQALWLFGPKAKSAAVVLIEVAKDRDDQLRERAIRALGSVEPDAELAVPALAAALSDSNADVRSAAGYALQSFGHEAKAAVPQILETLKDKDDGVRTAMVYALPAIAAADVAAPALATMLRDPSSYIRRDAAYRLGCFGPDAKVAIPALVKALNDQDDEVRSYARRALEKIRSKRQAQ